MSKTDSEIGQSLIEPVPVFGVQLPVMSHTKGAYLEKVKEKGLCRLLMSQIRQDVRVRLDEGD